MPFGNLLTGPHLVILLVIILLLFGSKRLPDLAKGISQSVKIFRSELKSDHAKPAAPTAEHTVPEAAAPLPNHSPATPDANPEQEQQHPTGEQHR